MILTFSQSIKAQLLYIVILFITEHRQLRAALNQHILTFISAWQILLCYCQQTQTTNEAQSLPRLLQTLSGRNQTLQDAKFRAKKSQKLEKIGHLVCQSSLSTHLQSKSTRTQTNLKHTPPTHPEQSQG